MCFTSAWRTGPALAIQMSRLFPTRTAQMGVASLARGAHPCATQSVSLPTVA